MSDFFKWDPASLSVRVDAMDAEHMGLIKIMNKLHDLHTKGAPTASLRTTAKELGAFTVKHFKHEEAYMESISHPGLATHKIIHKSLLEKFGEHVAKFEASGKFTEDFFLFLRWWLKSHIQCIDGKYSPSAGLSRPA